MNPILKRLNIFLDTGLQRIFVPLSFENYTSEDETLVQKNKDGQKDYSKLPQSMLTAVTEIEALWDKIPEEEREECTKNLKYFFDTFKGKIISPENCPYLKYSYGDKTWLMPNGMPTKLLGIWFLIETNTCDADENTQDKRYDRGTFFKKIDSFSDTFKEDILKEYVEENRKIRRGISPYISLSPGDSSGNIVPMKKKESDDEPEMKLLNGLIKFVICAIKKSGNIQEVDLVLDLGNTRTVGILFNHPPLKQDNPTRLSPYNIRANFKILRLCPDSKSGEYDSMDDMDAGIVKSWFVLHALDHQEYHEPNKIGQSSKPELLITEYKYNINEQEFPISKLAKIGSFFLGRRKKKEEVEIVYEDGTARKRTSSCQINYQVNRCEEIQRIPQMFSQLSPVLLGDAAERQFTEEYAKKMVQAGANIQQSSPKRYYWDDTPVTDYYWHLLLNAWDPKREMPLDEYGNLASNALPTLHTKT